MPQHLYIVQIVLQALSSFAIAGGLIFTALQFRHVRRTQHVANFAKLVEMQMRLREMRVHDPSLADVDRHDVEGLNSPQEIREYFLNLMQLSVFEIVWYSHKHGQIPDDYYNSWLTRMKKLTEEDSFRRMVNRPAMKILHDEFEEYMRKLVPPGASRGR
jgi:hypothetical protein